MLINPMKDLQECRAMLAIIKERKAKGWAIGLTSHEGQPDSVFHFFNERVLPLAVYVGPRFELGSSDAYDENIATLSRYIEELLEQERAQTRGTIAELKDRKRRNRPIGLTPPPCQPDAFIRFFALRALPFEPYYHHEAVYVGSPSAYDRNIKTLQGYLLSLDEPSPPEVPSEQPPGWGWAAVARPLVGPDQLG
jgi:hypothetical protein